METGEAGAASLPAFGEGDETNEHPGLYGSPMVVPLLRDIFSSRGAYMSSSCDPQESYTCSSDSAGAHILTPPSASFSFSPP